MANQYTIDNNQYPPDFFNPIIISVTEETSRNCQLSSNLRMQLTPGTPFTLTLDEAISTAERHMYIFDPNGPTRLSNPVKLVHDWVNLLRWEVSTFWKIYQGRQIEVAHTDNVHVHYTHEHPKRAGEVLAEGIALKFLEQRLGCPPQCFWFYKGAKARPDFIFDTPFRGIGMMLNGYQFGVEVRCRRSKANLHYSDERDLRGKKRANPQMSSLLGIYFFYGQGNHKNGSAMTRLHLADPRGDGNPMTEKERAWVIINHYLGVVSRVGLWDYQDYLLSCLDKLHNPRTPGTLEDTGFAMGTSETVTNKPFESQQKWQDFIGTGFNTLIEAGHKNVLDTADIDTSHRILQAQLDSGFFGYHVFKGIRKSVLELLDQAKWLDLEEYRDKSAGHHENGIEIAADGIFHQVVPLTDPETPHAKEVQEHMKEMGYMIKA